MTSDNDEFKSRAEEMLDRVVAAGGLRKMEIPRTKAGVIRSSAWADDEATVTTDVVWCTADGRKFSARVTFTAEQALDYAEKLRSAAQSLLRDAARPGGVV